MKRNAVLFLQAIVVMIGIGAFAIMLWEPHIEGRNANAELVEIYFNDPFLAYAYAASIAFFTALYQAFKLLGYIGQEKAFSEAAVKSVRTIKYCAVILVGFAAGGEIFIMLNHGSDDPSGGIFIGILIAFGSVIVAASASVFERILQNGIDLKSENK